MVSRIKDVNALAKKSGGSGDLRSDPVSRYVEGFPSKLWLRHGVVLNNWIPCHRHPLTVSSMLNVRVTEPRVHCVCGLKFLSLGCSPGWIVDS